MKCHPHLWLPIPTTGNTSTGLLYRSSLVTFVYRRTVQSHIMMKLANRGTMDIIAEFNHLLTAHENNSTENQTYRKWLTFAFHFLAKNIYIVLYSPHHPFLLWALVLPCIPMGPDVDRTHKKRKISTDEKHFTSSNLQSYFACIFLCTVSQLTNRMCPLVIQEHQEIQAGHLLHFPHLSLGSLPFLEGPWGRYHPENNMHRSPETLNIPIRQWIILVS